MARTPKATVESFQRTRNGKVHTVPGYRRNAPKPRWSDKAILDAIRKWVELYEQTPSMADWNPSLARQRGTPARQARYLNGLWPSTATVVRHFGSWVAALNAAGFEPNIAGPNDPLLGASRVENLSRGNLARLRGRASTLVGPQTFTTAVRAVVAAEKTGEHELLQDALLELAAVCVAWSDRADR